MAYQDVTVSLEGILSGNATGSELVGILIHLNGNLESSASGNVQVGLDEIISLTGTLSSTNTPITYQDTYVSLYGFLSASVYVKEDVALCPDIEVDMIISMITHSGCNEIAAREHFKTTTTKEKDMELTRYRGDTYPIYAKLGRNGDYDITGTTFKMSVQIEDNPIETTTGNPYDLERGIVEFTLPSTVVNTAGSGEYDIQGDNGYIYTYVKDTITIVDDITP